MSIANCILHTDLCFSQECFWEDPNSLVCHHDPLLIKAWHPQGPSYLQPILSTDSWRVFCTVVQLEIQWLRELQWLHQVGRAEGHPLWGVLDCHHCPTRGWVVCCATVASLCFGVFTRTRSVPDFEYVESLVFLGSLSSPFFCCHFLRMRFDKIYPLKTFSAAYFKGLQHTLTKNILLDFFIKIQQFSTISNADCSAMVGPNQKLCSQYTAP